METQLIEKQAVNATFKVTVPAADVDATFDRVLGTLARQVRVPGFRPGKAPRGVLVRRVGLEALQEEVQEALVDAHYPQAVKELDLSPIHAHFHADAPTEGADFTFEVHAELYPEVTLPPLEDVVIDAEGRALTDEMVSDAVEQLRRENATLVPVDRPIEATDYVLLEDATALPDGAGDAETSDAETSDAETSDAEEDAEAAEDGASAADADVSTTPVDMETAAEEIREQLFGKAIGDVIELQLTDDAAPEDEAAGGEAAEGEAARPTTRTLRVRVRDVKGKDKPEPDDEFAKTLGMEQWSDVEERVRASLREQLERESFESQRDEFVEKLVLGATFEIPNSLLQRRKQGLLEELADDLKRQNMTLERYLGLLEQRGTREEFEAELDASARRGVERDIVLERLLEVRGSEVADEEFEDAIRHLAARRRQDAGRFKREMGESWLRNYRFLMARDKALRETVAERVAASRGEDAPAGAGAPDAATAAEPAAVAPADAED